MSSGQTFFIKNEIERQKKIFLYELYFDQEVVCFRFFVSFVFKSKFGVNNLDPVFFKKAIWRLLKSQRHRKKISLVEHLHLTKFWSSAFTFFWTALSFTTNRLKSQWCRLSLLHFELDQEFSYIWGNFFEHEQSNVALSIAIFLKSAFKLSMKIRIVSLFLISIGKA